MLAAALALLSAFVPPADPAPRSPAAQWDLRGTSIVLVEGIRGGIIGPSRHRILSFGYDWNRGAFRAVEQKLEPIPGGRQRVFRARDLEGDEFRELVHQLLELGLPDLPLEEPAECEDLYGRGTGIRFSHAARVWENQAPGGCTSSRSSIQVTPRQIATFDAAVVLLNRALGGGPLQLASALDALPLRDWSELEVRLLRRTVDVLREKGLADRVNANEARLVGVGKPGMNIRLPCRSAQPFRCDRGPWASPVGWWDLRFDSEGDHLLELRETPIPGASAADAARRAAFVEAHPELSAAQRELILAGWVEGGMSEAMVLAAWGEPVDRSQSSTTTMLRYVRECADREQSRVTLTLYSDRLLFGR